MTLSAALRSIWYIQHPNHRKMGQFALYGLLTLRGLLAIIGRESELCIAVRQDCGWFAMNHFVKNFTRARGGRTHRRSSSPRPLVLKTRTATGPHPLSARIVAERHRAVKHCIP